MGATHDEFIRFLHWLRQQESDADVHRVAKIIHRHIDTLISTVRNGGSRRALSGECCKVPAGLQGMKA
jgi:hypothetical protein